MYRANLQSFYFQILLTVAITSLFNRLSMSEPQQEDQNPAQNTINENATIQKKKQPLATNMKKKKNYRNNPYGSWSNKNKNNNHAPFWEYSPSFRQMRHDAPITGTSTWHGTTGKAVKYTSHLSCLI